MIEPIPVRPGGIRGQAAAGPEDLRVGPDERVGPHFSCFIPPPQSTSW